MKNFKTLFLAFMFINSLLTIVLIIDKIIDQLNNDVLFNSLPELSIKIIFILPILVTAFFCGTQLKYELKK